MKEFLVWENIFNDFSRRFSMGQRPLFRENWNRSIVNVQRNASDIYWLCFVHHQPFVRGLLFLIINFLRIILFLLVVYDHLLPVVFDHQCLYLIHNSKLDELLHRNSFLSSSKFEFNSSLLDNHHQRRTIKQSKCFEFLSIGKY